MRTKNITPWPGLFIIWLCLISSHLYALTATLEVLSPPNYAFILKGMTIQFRWTTSEPTDKVKLFYFFQQGDMTGDGDLMTWLPPGGQSLPLTDTYTWDFKAYGSYVPEATYHFFLSATKGSETVQAGNAVIAYFMWSMMAPTYCYPEMDSVYSGEKYQITWNWTPCTESYEVQESTS